MHIINAAGIGYHQNAVLNIIKPTEIHTCGVVRYNNGFAVVDDIHAMRGDIPSLSAWIKKERLKVL